MTLKKLLKQIRSLKMTILDVDHVVEAVVADNPIVCEEIIESGLPCTSIAPLCQAIVLASPGFLAFDPIKFDALIKEHNNPSEKNEAWAQNWFNTWREIRGLDSNIPIEDLLFVVLSDLLCKFFSIVCKLDGSLYPPSFINMYMSFNQMICRSQEDR